MIFIPESQVPGMIWPAINDGMSAMLLALEHQFEQTEWLEPASIQQMQFVQLSQLLQFASKTVPFYEEYYRQCGFIPEQTITADNWQNVPIIKRSDIQQAGDKLLSNSMPDSHGKPVQLSTSGSTGKQVTVYANAITQLVWNALNLRDHLWHERNLHGTLAVIKLAPREQGQPDASPPDGAKANNWGTATMSYRTGPSFMLDISASVTQQLEWLQKVNPHYLLTYPSNLRALLHEAGRHNIKLENLHQLRTLGEVVDPELRNLCEQIWGAAVYDVYSCQEAGYLAIQCPEHSHYHVQSENVLLEVLDDANQPCKAGETGRVIISCLNNFSTPLIRYELGDYAEVGEPCPCGRGLPVLKRISGRSRNMVTYPDGAKRWPYTGSARYREVADIRQFQLVQTAPDKIEVHLVIGEGGENDHLTAEQEQQLGSIIQQSMDSTFTLQFHYSNEIARSRGGKYEDFISLI